MQSASEHMPQILTHFNMGVIIATKCKFILLLNNLDREGSMWMEIGTGESSLLRGRVMSREISLLKVQPAVASA